MKRVIDGKIYDTKTAEEICELPCSAQGKSDFRYHDTDLYRTKRGAYFLAGEGGAMSMWAQSVGNAYTWGDGLRVISKEEAREYAEAAELSPEDMQAAGFEIEEG